MKKAPLIAGIACAAACTAGIVLWLGQEPSSPSPPPAAKSKGEAAKPRMTAGPAPVPAPPGKAPAAAAEPGAGLGPDAEAVAAGQALAGKDMEAALRRLMELKGSPTQSFFLQGVFKHVATLGLEGSLTWLRRLKDPELKAMAQATVLEEWAGADVSSLARGQPPAMSLGLFLAEQGRATPAQIVSYANEFLESSADRATLLATAAARMVAQDPVKAFRLGEGLDGEDQMTFLRHYANSWAAQNAKAAWDWSLGIPDAATRQELQGLILQAEARGDLAAAVQHLSELPGDSQVREETARRLASLWAQKDLPGAQQWKDSLPPGSADARGARRGIEDVVPIAGIGVALSLEEGQSSGYPTVRELVAGGSAAAAGTLRPGDRIVEVMDAKGAWMGAKFMPLEQVTEMIRGAAGTAVSLRVLPAEGGAHRVIRLTRQQIGMQAQ